MEKISTGVQQLTGNCEECGRYVPRLYAYNVSGLCAECSDRNLSDMKIRIFGRTFRPRRYKAGLVKYILWKTGDYSERHQFDLYRMPIGTIEKMVLDIKAFDKEKGEVPAGGTKYRRYLLNLRLAFKEHQRGI